MVSLPSGVGKSSSGGKRPLPRLPGPKEKAQHSENERSQAKRDDGPIGSRKLANRSEMRLRIGDYRVLYLIDDVRRTVTISVIAHRREVYR